jgi:hypothetical protein
VNISRATSRSSLLGSGRFRTRGLAGLAVAALTVAGTALPGTASTSDAGTPAEVSVQGQASGADLGDDAQGFSVESADLAHGFLTSRRMADRLDTLGRHGVIRVGGYSMDLVWPAFGHWAHTPAPPEAIGGTVDQSDLDALKRLTHDSGWKVSIGLPLKKTIDPAKIKDPTKDPSPAVSLDQAVAEVRAAYRTLGKDLVGVEVGNEYDNVTTLTAAEMWEQVKRYQRAVDEALPHAHLKVIGPSANTATTNTRLEDFFTAIQQDQGTDVHRVLGEVSSHLYPGSHCGASNTTIAKLLSSATYDTVQSKLDGIREIGNRLEHPLPMTINESNSASCSGQPGVSNAYAMSLWSLDYLMQATRAGIARVQFHTSTAAVCGDFKPRDSADYPVSYRYYGAFCADDQADLDAGKLSPMPLYYGLWAFRQVPQGRFVDVSVSGADSSTLRGYGVRGRNGELTVVLVDLTDPAAADAAPQPVRIGLPGSVGRGRALTLASSDPAGLSSLDVSRISLGGRTVTPSGNPSGNLRTTSVSVHGRTATVDLAPGSAQVITFDRAH